MEPMNEILACILSPEKLADTLQTIHERMLESLRLIQEVLEQSEKEREHGYNHP